MTLDYDLKYLDEPNQWNWRYGQRLDLGPWTFDLWPKTVDHDDIKWWRRKWWWWHLRTFWLRSSSLSSLGSSSVQVSFLVHLGRDFWMSTSSPAATGPHRPVRSLQHHHHCHLPKAASRAATTFHKFSRSGITRKISPVTITCSQGLQPRLQVNAVGNGEVREAPFQWRTLHL